MREGEWEDKIQVREIENKKREECKIQSSGLVLRMLAISTSDPIALSPLLPS